MKAAKHFGWEDHHRHCLHQFGSSDCGSWGWSGTMGEPRVKLNTNLEPSSHLYHANDDDTTMRMKGMRMRMKDLMLMMIYEGLWVSTNIRYIWRWFIYTTAFQYNHSFGFQKPMKVKVVKWGWKKWNKHDMMHIYHKQCEIIQKIEWNSSNGQIHCFHYVR